MTRSALILVQSALVRAACAQPAGRGLRALQDSFEQACGLPHEPWERKATAHAEFHIALADATGMPGLALLARIIGDSLQDMIVKAGPCAESLIIESRRRLLGHLQARDADSAAQEIEDHLAHLDEMCCQTPAAEASAAKAAEAAAPALAHNSRYLQCLRPPAHATLLGCRCGVS